MSERVPMRLCAACRTSKEKSKLIRLVDVNGAFVVDYKKIMPGRGIYLCPNEVCIKNALKKKALNRNFPNTSTDIIEDLLNEVMR